MLKTIIDVYEIVYEISFESAYDSRWMDGAFLDLNSETISNEVQEFWTDIFKINKFFQQLKKKEMLEKANKEGVKRKKAEDSKDEEEVPAIIVCNKIMDGIKEFKVRNSPVLNSHVLGFVNSFFSPSLSVANECWFPGRGL